MPFSYNVTVPPNHPSKSAISTVETLPDARAALQRCKNCRLPCNATFSGLASDGAVFCSINCYWSDTLDVNKSRTRRKKRSGGTSRRRNRTRPVAAIVTASVNEDAEEEENDDDDFVFPPTGNDATLAQQAFCLSGTDVR